MQAATGGTIVTLITLAILVLVGLGIIAYFVGIYNNLVRLKNMIDRSFADIDVVLKQRHDELPKLIETCKGYMQYEQKTLEAVVEARNGYARATTPAEKTQADNMITGALRTLDRKSDEYAKMEDHNTLMQIQKRTREHEGRSYHRSE